MTSVAQPGATPDRWPVAYLVAQAAAVLAWWIAVIASRTVRTWFFPYGGLDPAFAAFLLPDLAFVVAGSLVVARQKLRGAGFTRASGVLLGAVGYATLYTLAWTFLVQAPPTSAIAMAILVVGTWRASAATASRRERGPTSRT
jgi:hypothetical protein